MNVKSYLITVFDDETGSSSSYGSDSLMDVIVWGFNWAGIRAQIEAVAEEEHE